MFASRIQQHLNTQRSAQTDRDRSHRAKTPNRYKHKIIKDAFITDVIQGQQLMHKQEHNKYFKFIIIKNEK